MKLGVPKETRAGERRVALVPESVKRLRSKGFDVLVEGGAGVAASFLDSVYQEAGATIASSADEVLSSADVILHVNAPTSEEVGRMRAGAAAVGLMFPLVSHDLVRRLRDAKVTGIALDRVPRITLAQSMDVLSSQSTVAGYRSVLVAAAHLPKLFPLMMTAAGRIEAARVLVLGAGVAGLQAIGTARRLGAVVEAYDVRAVVKEQIESLGASFVEVESAEDAETAGGYAKDVSEEQQKRANEVIARHLEHTDVCITTALIPGRPAPRLLTADMARRMRAGSVIVDLAAEQGGNCELTKPGEVVIEAGITIVGPTNLPSEVPFDASQMFSRNIEKLLIYLATDGSLQYDFGKEIVSGSVFTHDGKIVDEQVAELVGA
ncbi:MAG: Re/Si-specific NAD(P)(+) transhydrogenase subunit alpha [Myxococcales bacterium]|nr:MAG: Re/Si-specific NAD(P)(+) transhydrogenase subunit alpha [Myxococcales bacterium]